MSNNINVTLDTSMTPPVLSVHDHGGIHVDKHSKPQTISWNLTGNLAQGAFVAMDQPQPGFQWVGDPPADGIFGTSQVGANGNSLDLVDDHSHHDTDGTWIYQLRVELDGTVYSTVACIGPGETKTNPVIINR
jgi:hypothetical protein